MKVIAFSCAHICTPETQMDLQDHSYNYDNIRELLEICAEKTPDFLINLGDFTEPRYDSRDVSDKLLFKEIPLYYEISKYGVVVRRINGNHDTERDTDNVIDIDNVRYEHGHQLIGVNNRVSRKEYANLVHESTKDINYKLVHGHTHTPKEGNPLDVGSITFTGTYGEIIDGKEFYLRKV